MIVYGLVLIVIMIVLPQGLFRGIQDIYGQTKFSGQSPSAGSKD
jgi:hypothetical protein